jgi:TIR domain
VAKRVFISYRREDTAPAAGRVYDRLCQLLSKPNVFFDVSTIAGGEIFDRKLMSEIERSDAVLVFIGKSWLVVSGGRARLEQPGDYVRAEVSAALERPVLVLPVLVDGARMPLPDQLPEDIRAITSRNALLLRHEASMMTSRTSCRPCWVSPGARGRGMIAAALGSSLAMRPPV